MTPKIYLLAVPLALFGDVRHAAKLAELLPAGSTPAREHAALVRWRGGDAAGAIAELAALDAQDPGPSGTSPGIAPSYLLAEVSAAAGDWRGTLTAEVRSGMIDKAIVLIPVRSTSRCASPTDQQQTGQAGTNRARSTSSRLRPSMIAGRLFASSSVGSSK